MTWKELLSNFQEMLNQWKIFSKEENSLLKLHLISNSCQTYCEIKNKCQEKKSVKDVLYVNILKLKVRKNCLVKS